MPSEPLLTKREVMEQLHVSIATLNRLIQSGALPVVRLGDGPKPMVRFRPEAVEAYLAASAA